MAAILIHGDTITQLKGLLSGLSVSQVRLRAVLTESFFTDSGEWKVKGKHKKFQFNNSINFFQCDVLCTVDADGIITYPDFTLESTEDGADRQDSAYMFGVYSADGELLAVLNDKDEALRVPDAPDETSLGAIAVYNGIETEDLADTFPTTEQMQNYVDLSATPDAAVGTKGKGYISHAGDTFVGTEAPVYKDGIKTFRRSQFSGTLAAAFASIAAITVGEYEFLFADTEAIAGSITTPTNALIRVEGSGVFNITSGTLTLSRFQDPGHRKVFNCSGAGSVAFAQGSVPVLRTAWLTGPRTSGVTAAAFGAAMNTLIASQGNVSRIEVPPGIWKTNGGHVRVSYSQIAGCDRLTTIQLTDADANGIATEANNGASIFIVNQSTNDITFENMVFDCMATNTAARAIKLTDTSVGGTPIIGVHVFKCSFVNGHTQFDMNPAFLAGREMQQVHLENCYFGGASSRAIYCNTANSTISITHPYTQLAAGSDFLYAAAIGALYVKGGAGSLLGGAGSADPVTNVYNAAANGTNGTTVLNVTGASFSRADKGYPVSIAGLSAPFSTTIASVTDADTIVLADALPEDVVNKTATIGSAKPDITARPRSAFYLAGQHGNIVIQGVQDEAMGYFLINDINVGATINLIGNLVQAPILFKQTCYVLSQGNYYTRRMFRDEAGASARVISIGDDLNPTDNGLVAGDRVLSAFDGSSLMISEDDFVSVYKNERRYQKLLFNSLFNGSPATPMFQIGSSEDEKVFLRLGQITSATEAFSNYYDIKRTVAAPYAGWLSFAGNQADVGNQVYTGYLFNGPVITTSKTITAAGTTGNRTINKQTGTVNIAAGASSVVVTNSLVTVNSIVLPVLRTADGTTKILSCVPAAGSFTITLDQNAGTEVSIGFRVD